jgi:flagellar hook-associated protein 1 FlgK
MRGVSTFGAFTTARLGIFAAQKGLDVTGHNITNINTTGYTRQRLDQMSLRVGGTERYASKYDTLVGSGVLCTGVSQLRDPYLDIRFRNEQASVGAMDAKLAGLDELTTVLDEVAKGDGKSGIMEAQFNDLYTQLQNLSTKAGQEEYDTLVRSSAYSLVKLFNNYSERLSTIEKNQISDFKQDISSVNTILTNIRDLNDSIMKSEIHGDPSLELKDKRNLLIDELSQYTKIKVEYQGVPVGAGQSVDKLVIHLTDKSGSSLADLVDGNFARQLSIRQVETSPGSGVFVDGPNYDLDLSSFTNSKGNLMSGSTVVNLGDNDLYGSIQSTREILTKDGEFTVGGDASKRGIPYYQKALDTLANQFAKVINDSNTGYLKNSTGDYLDTLGNITTTPATNGIKLGGPLFSNSSSSDTITGITASNISISQSWSTGTTRIQRSFVKGATDLKPNSTDNSNIEHMLVLMKSKQDYTAGGGTVYFKGSFQEMLINTSATLANDVKTTTTLLNNYVASADEMNTSRDSVSSVDLNDEATNMMQYQKSYAAACRLMTTLDEALDKLINGTGMVGR